MSASNEALWARLDEPVPRYTSYPPVPAWNEGVTDAQWRAGVAALQGEVDVYVHVPFCEESCWYCGCHRIVAKSRTAGDRFVGALLGTMAHLPPVRARSVHIGGGTPTWLPPGGLTRLLAGLRRAIPWAADAEVGVECDPEVTTEAHLEAMRAGGVTRLSFGVQSFDPRVLAAIGRPQDGARVRSLLAVARAMGFRGINLDLLYGLPHQDDESLRSTAADAVACGPDRLALYGYAHVPSAFPLQRRLPADALPSGPQRVRSMLVAREALGRAGYLPVGMDHFARPDDALAVAAGNGTLRRSFMGYTAGRASAVLGFGPSAISRFAWGFVQQPVRLDAWYRGEGLGRSHRLDADDVRRGALIEALLCDLWMPGDAADPVALTPWLGNGVVVAEGGGFRVTEFGRPFARHVARLLDASGASGKARGT